MLIKFLLLFCYLISFRSASGSDGPERSDSVSVWLVKQRWHTGLVLNTAEIDSAYFPEFSLIKKFRYIDAGWGDEEFYRHPDFDLALAFQALFYSPSSALRIEGFNFDVGKYIGFSDIGFEIKLARESFNRLCSFISSTFYKDLDGKTSIIEERYSGNITFYRAEGEYHLFNTCNTWIAEGFRKTGIKIDRRIVLAEQLFDEIAGYSFAERLK